MSKVTGYDSCLYAASRDVVYDFGDCIFASIPEAAAHAIKLAEWRGADACDAAVRTRYDNGICEVMYEPVEFLAGAGRKVAA